MGETFKMSVPQFRRLFKKAEFFESSVLGNSFSCLSAKVQPDTLKEVSTRMTNIAKDVKLTFKTITNSKGENKFLPILEGGDKKASIPYVEQVYEFLTMFFAVKVFNSEVNGIRLIDQLETGVPVLKDGQVTRVKYHECFENEKQAESILGKITPGVDLMEQLLSRYYTFLDSADSSTIKDFVGNLGKLSQLKLNDGYLDTSLLTLLYLSSIIESFGKFLKAGKPTSSVSNCKLQELPPLLDQANGLSTIVELMKHEIIESSILTNAQTSEIALSDVFTYVNGSICLNLNFLSSFTELSCINILANVIDVIVRQATIDLKIKSLPGYIKDSITLAALSNQPVSELIRLLSGLVFDAKEIDSDVIVSNKPLDVLQRGIQTQDGWYGDLLQDVCKTLSTYYTEVKFTDIRGFSIQHDLVGGRAIIFRMSEFRNTAGSPVFASGHIRGKNKGDNRVLNFRTVSVNPEVVKWTQNRLVKNPYPNFQLTGQTGAMSKYGVALENIDQALLRTSLQKMACYLAFTVDKLNDSVVGTLRNELFTIFPPSMGEDVISFGKTSRRERSSQEFTKVKLSVETADYIDLLFAFPSRAVVGASSDELKRLYLNRLQQLCDEPQSGHLIRRAPVSRVRNERATLDFLLKMTTPSSGSLNQYIGHETNFLPNDVSLEHFATQSLPKQVKVDPSFDFTLKLPLSLINTNNSTFPLLSSNNLLEGPVGTDGIPLYYAFLPSVAPDKLIKVGIDKKSLPAPEVVTPTGNINEVVYIKLHLCTRDVITFASNNSIKCKDGSYFARLVYADPVINSLVEKDTIISLGDFCCGVDSRLFKRSFRADGDSAPIQSALKFFSHLLISVYSSLTGVFEKDTVRSYYDEVLNEVSVLQQYLETNFHPSLPFACLLDSGIGSLERFLDNLKELKSVLEAKPVDEQKLTQCLTKVMTCLSLQSVDAIAKTGFYIPLFVDELVKGTISSMLKGYAEFFVAPVAIGGVNLSSLNNVLNTSTVEMLQTAISNFIEQKTTSFSK